jgi:hypothetical protein
LPANVNFTSKGSLLQKGYTSSLKIKADLGEKCMPGIILLELIQELELPLDAKLSIFSNDGQVENFRGRQFAGETESQQIVSMRGHITAPESDPLPIDINLKSFFSTFVGKSNITYSLKGNSSSLVREVLPELKLEQAFKLLPVRWQKVSLGLEFFKKSLFSSMFGSSPTIYKRLYIDLEQRELNLFAEETMISEKGIAPLEEENLKQAVLKVFENRRLPGIRELKDICKDL